MRMASQIAGAVRAVASRTKPSRSVLSITPQAACRIKELVADNKEGAVALKIGTLRRGCNGLSYTMTLAKEKGKFDEEVVHDGARIFIDNKALMSVLGSEMDFVDEKLSTGFVFNNPNVKHTCACGESFTT